jgi:hypothetical protein
MAFQTSPFSPGYGHGTVLSPAASSANAAIDAASQTLCLTNLGANVCYVRVTDDATATASTADYPIPGGAQVTVTKPREFNRIAHISASGTTLHVMPGEGF